MTTRTAAAPFLLPPPRNRSRSPATAPIRPRRLAAGLGLCLLALVLPGGGTPLRKADRTMAAHAAARRPVIAAALERTSPDPVLIAGNSHAELAGRAGLPCAPS